MRKTCSFLILFVAFAFPALGQGQLRFTLPSFASGGGTGNVAGPGSACADNQIPRWDGASATQLQCSASSIFDSGAVKFGSDGPVLSPSSSPWTHLRLTDDAGTAPQALTAGSMYAKGISLYGSGFTGAPDYSASGNPTISLSSTSSPPYIGVAGGGYLSISSSGSNADNGQTLHLTNGGDGVLKISDASGNEGMAQLGDSGAALPTCDANSDGVIAYDKDEHEFCGCNGTAWAPLDGAGTCD